MLLAVDTNEDIISVLDMDDLILERVRREDINNAIQHGIVFENIDCDMVCRHPNAKIKVSQIKLLVVCSSGVQNIGVEWAHVFDKLWRMPPVADIENNFGLKMFYVRPYELRLKAFIEGSVYDIDMRYVSDTSEVHINNQYILSLESYTFREFGFIGYVKQDHVLVLSLYEVSFILSKSNLYISNSSGGDYDSVCGSMEYGGKDYTIGDFKRMLLLGD